MCLIIANATVDITVTVRPFDPSSALNLGRQFEGMTGSRESEAHRLDVRTH